MATEFDYSVLHQKPNNWLPTNIGYEGEGSAEFQDPKGQVWGKTKFVFDEFCECTIEMQVERFEAKKPLPGGLLQLISADQPKEDGGRLMLPIPPSKYNLCTKLSVKTQEGEFVAENIEWLSISSRYDNTGEKQTLYFHPRLSRFDVTTGNSAYYWAMPLINFISNFMQYDPQLGNHPLRIFPDVNIPPNIPPEFKARAEYIVRQKSRFILFEFNKAPGFIEALPDYKDKEARLMERRIPSTITSVMVGEIGNNSIDVDKIMEWFPLYFLDLLSLASGYIVTIPWIEVRDQQGNLVRRVHGNMGFGQSIFIKGQKGIDEVFHRGTGRLLTVAQSCADLGESYIRVALRHTLLGERYSSTVEDQLDHFCRALDSLCEHYGFSKQDLISLTSETDKKTIRTVLNNAAISIKSISDAAQSSGDFTQSRYLQTVIGRLSNVTNTDVKFGLAVCDLLKKFNLPDADIIDVYFANNPRKDNIKKWADLLSTYRGQVVHIGYFNFKTKEHEINDIMSVIRHLNDILLRILFMILGYDGKYDPPVFNETADMAVNWVQPNTPVSQLGYK